MAEHALGLMLALARAGPSGRPVRQRRPVGQPGRAVPFNAGCRARGRTLGIIGLGAVGRKTAALAQAFGMTCLAYDPYVDEPADDVRMVELDDLLAASDVVRFMRPATPETAGLLDARRIGLMPSTAYIVNCQTRPSLAKRRSSTRSARRGLRVWRWMSSKPSLSRQTARFSRWTTSC